MLGAALLIVVSVLVALLFRGCEAPGIGIGTDIGEGHTKVIIRERFDTIVVHTPPTILTVHARPRIEYDTLREADTAMIRALVATLDSARTLLRQRGVRSSFALDTATDHYERLWVLCDETRRTITLDLRPRPRDTVIRTIDTTTIIERPLRRVLAPYAQLAAVWSPTGSVWTAQATLGARLPLTTSAAAFADGQLDFGVTSRVRLGIDITF